MKKFIPLLIASLFACWSCNLEDTYTETNVKDMVTVKDGQMINDYGNLYNVVDDAVGASKWKAEGARYLIIFDILNRNLDISLKSVLPSLICDELPLLDETTELSKDPVELLIQGFSGGYYNVGFTITSAKNSEYEHYIDFYYTVDGNELTLYVEHFGNGEDITHMSSDDLVAEDRMFSIQLEDLPKFSTLNLVMYCITTEGGEKVVQKVTANIR